MVKPSYRDIADFPEDDRIAMIGQKAMNERLIVGFFVDDEPGKAERYISKLQARFPDIRIIDKVPGPVPGTTLVRVGPPLT